MADGLFCFLKIARERNHMDNSLKVLLYNRLYFLKMDAKYLLEPRHSAIKRGILSLALHLGGTLIASQTEYH